MLEKNQKKFTLTIGSNREATEQDLINMALWLENTGNETPNGFKFHIFIKDNDYLKSEGEEINSQEVKPTTKPRVKRKRKEPVIYRDFKQEDNPSTPDNTLSELSEVTDEK